jgi:hypothetical protein
MRRSFLHEGVGRGLSVFLVQLRASRGLRDASMLRVSFFLYRDACRFGWVVPRFDASATLYSFKDW